MDRKALIPLSVPLLGRGYGFAWVSARHAENYETGTWEKVIPIAMSDWPNGFGYVPVEFDEVRWDIMQQFVVSMASPGTRIDRGVTLPRRLENSDISTGAYLGVSSRPSIPMGQTREKFAL